MTRMIKFPSLNKAADCFVAKRGKLLIGSDCADAVSGKTFDTIDPETEGVIRHLAEAGARDVDRAVKAA
jgi:hypothetical protein